MPGEKRLSIDEQVELASRQNSAKDRDAQADTAPDQTPRSSKGHVYKCRYCSTFESSGARGLSAHKQKEHPAEVARERTMTPHQLRVLGRGKKNGGKPKKKDRDLENFKERLAAVHQQKPAKRRTGGIGAKRKRKAAKLAAKREYVAKWRAARKEAAAQRRTNNVNVTAISSNGTLPPHPFKFCPECSKAMPTVEHNGKVMPAAKPYCGDCGYKIPTMMG